MAAVTLDCGGRRLALTPPAVMGVLNVTPDSFSDGGRFVGRNRAIDHAMTMVEAGAGIIDIGGESTRPGAAPVSVSEEIDRVVPLIEALAGEVPVPLSVDTSKPEVMAAAAMAGAGLINDVYALRLEGALSAAATTGLPVCVMHMQGEPRTMQRNPVYEDVVSEVGEFLAARLEACLAAGIPRDRLIADPGFGFGKNAVHNATLLNRLDRLRSLGVPLLIGLSRKSFLGRITGREVGARMPASVAVAAMAVCSGASIVRAHDVAATVDAVKMAHYVMTEGEARD